MRRTTRTEFDELVEEAAVDCYGEDEQISGLYTMIVDNRRNNIVAVCSRGASRQAISVLDLPLPAPAPPGAQWIEAYRHWAR